MIVFQRDITKSIIERYSNADGVAFYAGAVNVETAMRLLCERNRHVLAVIPRRCEPAALRLRRELGASIILNPTAAMIARASLAILECAVEVEFSPNCLVYGAAANTVMIGGKAIT